MDAPDAGRIIRAPARRKRNDEQLMDRVSTISVKVIHRSEIS